MIPESLEGYKKYEGVGDDPLRRYLAKSARDWTYEHCGNYTIYFKPHTASVKYEVLAVVKYDNTQCTKTVLIPNEKVEFFEEVTK